MNRLSLSNSGSNSNPPGGWARGYMLVSCHSEWKTNRGNSQVCAFSGAVLIVLTGSQTCLMSTP